MILKNILPIVLFIGLLLLSACDQTHQPPTTHEHTSEHPEAAEREFPEKIEIPAADGLPVTAHLYHYSDEAPTLLLCHQARFNKFEYAGIAPKLHEMGFNCLALDQRSGGPISIHPNETYNKAVQLGKESDFLDAEQDILAGLEWAANAYNGPVYLWGSSYSSTLVLYIVAENETAAGAISFSPGDYFAPEKGSLVDKLKDLEKPLFLTSSQSEAPEVSQLIAGKTLTANQIQFIPEGPGHHGSRALWETQPGGEEYWNAILPFLEQLKTSP